MIIQRNCKLKKMETKNKYPEVRYELPDGTKLPCEMLVWDYIERNACKSIAICYVPNAEYPIKTIDKSGYVGGYRNAKHIIEEPSEEFWKNLPKWAKWVAQDDAGTQWWFANEPNIGHGVYWSAWGSMGNIPSEYKFPFTGDWKDSKFKSPENI